MELAKDILVEISFLPTEHGGRGSPARSGYRPQFYYDNNDWDAAHTYIGVSEVKPGEKVKAYLTFASPQEHFGKLMPGSHFLLREGQRIIGYGHVIEIIDLEKSAKKL